MTWRGQLDLRYAIEAGRQRAFDAHSGPLRVLKALQPDGALSCEHVLVHPPGGIAAGDVLNLRIELGAGTRVRITTPGATRFYRSTGAWAEQSAHVRVGPQARLEWLPLETLAHGACRARNSVHFHLDDGAQLMGWDVVCLGLPASGDRFEQGVVEQELGIEGLWLERAHVQAQDAVLRQSRLGLAGHPVWATMWWACGQGPAPVHAALLVEATRLALAPEPVGQASPWAVTQPDARLVVVRALADRVEPILNRFKAIRRAWFEVLAWGACREPRIWQL